MGTIRCNVDIKLFYKYFDGLNFLRHPIEGNINKYSRDQLICFVAGFYKVFKQTGYKSTILRYAALVYRPENGDIITPSQRNHLKICAELPRSWLGDMWFWFDVYWHCYISPLSEPNQLICMMLTHPNKSYLKYWVSHNSSWLKSIRYYWFEGPGAWREEPGLTVRMVTRILVEVSKK